VGVCYLIRFICDLSYDQLGGHIKDRNYVDIGILLKLMFSCLVFIKIHGLIFIPFLFMRY